MLFDLESKTGTPLEGGTMERTIQRFRVDLCQGHPHTAQVVSVASYVAQPALRVHEIQQTLCNGHLVFFSNVHLRSARTKQSVFVSPLRASQACSTRSSRDVGAVWNYRELENLEHGVLRGAAALCPASGRLAYGCDVIHVDEYNCVHIVNVV